MGTLNISSNSRIVTEGEPCNVTCYALGWTPLPDISWELEVPVSHSSYYSLLDPGDFTRALSVLTLTPLGNGTLTCVAELMNLQASKSLTVNLTVVQPPPGKWASPARKLWLFMGGSGSRSWPTWTLTLMLGGDGDEVNPVPWAQRVYDLTCSYNSFLRVFLFPICKWTIEKPCPLLR